MPPLVPAIVNAGVVVDVAIDTMPPVQLTSVTLPVPTTVDHTGKPPLTVNTWPFVPMPNLAGVPAPSLE